MNVLYISCHAVLEFDELKLLNTIPNLHVRSTGAYADPRQHPALRPALPDLEVSDDHIRNSFLFNTGGHKLNDELLNWADVVIFMHMPEWIHESLDDLDRHGDVRVIYRSIGQSAPNVETMLRNYSLHFGSRFSIVRYSPNEQFIKNFQKSDNLIRFYKDPQEFRRTEPPAASNHILMSTQNGLGRGNFTHTREALEISAGHPRLYVGTNNEDIRDHFDCPIANPDYEELKKVYREARIFLYTGTVPASYTLSFIEALMSGLPIVTISGKMWAKEHLGWISPDVFEAPEIVGPAATIHSIEDGQDLLAALMSRNDIIEEWSQFNRDRALELFAFEPIRDQWRQLLFA